jgi:hypothetical protein
MFKSRIRRPWCRLIAALFDQERSCLSTCCSAPINVLANNDAPNGPAFIDLDLPISDSWEGWCQADLDLDFEVHPRNDSVNSIPLTVDGFRMDSTDPSGYYPPPPSCRIECTGLLRTPLSQERT